MKVGSKKGGLGLAPMITPPNIIKRLISDRWMPFNTWLEQGNIEGSKRKKLAACRYHRGFGQH